MREENLKHHKIKGSQMQQGRKKQNSKVIMQQKQRRRKTLTLWRITKYGANSFVRNAWLLVAATAVMTVTLVIIFGSLLARSILMDTVDDIKNKVDMSIYLKKGVSNSDIEKMKKSIKALVLLFLLAGIMFFSKSFIDSDYFKVQEVLVEGQFDLLRQDIVAPLEQMKGKNIVYLDTNDIENLIKTDIRVKKVSIKKLFPSKIQVVLEEREPYVYVKKGDETLIADKDLNIYGDILEEPAKNIPIIDYTNDESLKEMKTILSKIRNKDFYAMISEIRQSEKNYEILLTNNVRIITETLVTEKKYDEAYKIYERIKKERPVTSMDLRFIDQTIVK